MVAKAINMMNKRNNPAITFTFLVRHLSFWVQSKSEGVPKVRTPLEDLISFKNFGRYS